MRHLDDFRNMPVGYNRFVGIPVVTVLLLARVNESLFDDRDERCKEEVESIKQSGTRTCCVLIKNFIWTEVRTLKKVFQFLRREQNPSTRSLVLLGAVFFIWTVP